MQFYNQLIIFGVIYIALVLALTYAGSKRKIGGEPIFFISLLFTPLIGFVFLFTSPTPTRETKPKYYICPHCGFSLSEKKQFCPVCDKDEEGHTLLEIRKAYQEKEAVKPKEVPSVPEIKIPKRPKIEVPHKNYHQN